MKPIQISLLLVAMLWANPLWAQESYKIEFVFDDLKDTEVQIARRFGKGTFIKDTVQVNARGKAVYEGSKALPGGIYLVVHNKDFMEFLVDDNQEFEIRTTLSEPLKNAKVKGSKENEIYFKSQLILQTNREKALGLLDKIDSLGKGSADAAPYQEKLDSLNGILQNEWQRIVAQYPETFYAKLLEASNGEPGKFYDNIDFSEPSLMGTPVIYTAMRSNMARDLNAHKPAETILKNAKRFIEKSKASDKMFEYVLMYHLRFYGEEFQRAGINKVFVGLVDEYVRGGQAHWLDSTARASIIKQAETWGSAFPGKKAPNIEAITPEGDVLGLYDLQTRYTLLVFWKTGCGHCEDAMERINAFYDSASMDLSVFAVFTKKNKKGWTEFIAEHDFSGWHHVYDPKNESKYQQNYYVVSTPIVLLLDEDKTVVSSRIGDEGIMEMITQLESQKEKFMLE